MMWWADRWRSACATSLIKANPEVDSGQTLAAKGRASVEQIEPGLVRATVRDRRDYAVEIGVQQLPPALFDEVAGEVAEDPMLAAALLTGELPIEVDGFFLRRGSSLLPLSTDVLAECECHEYHSPCRHGVAALIAIADVLAKDPFALTLLRGAGRDRFVAKVRECRGDTGAGEHTDEPRGVDPGRSAGAAFRRTVTAPPPAGVPPRVAVPPAALVPEPPLDSGLHAADLASLVHDASLRAVALLRGEGDGSLRSSVEADLARRAAATIETGLSLVSLSEAAGIDDHELRERARCWTIGGPDALAVRTERWNPDSALTAEASRLFDPPGRVSGNSISSGSLQLRIDQSGRWWRFMAHPTKGWLLDSGGFVDPADALDDEL